MERVKELIRYMQIRKEINGSEHHMPTWRKSFDEFCEKGEKVWIEENLTQNKKYHLSLIEEGKKRDRFERIQNIREKTLWEHDFSEFSHDEKAWLERQNLTENELKEVENAGILSLIDLLRFISR